MMRRYYLLLPLGGLALVQTVPVAAQSTCTDAYQGCVKFNSLYGVNDVDRCKGYLSKCKRTGEFCTRKGCTTGLAKR
jgi:hypothetical protein